MIAKISLTLAGLTFFFALAVSGCSHMASVKDDIVLDGFSDENYAALERNIGGSSCIVGNLNIDNSGIYFLLKPRSHGDTLDPYASRIVAGLSYQYARRNNMKDGSVYRLCGTLRDATPFKKCNSNFCKWYELEDARL